MAWLAYAVAFGPRWGQASDVWFGGDQALILGAAGDTLQGHGPFVGAYSRDGLYHPGPLYTYAVALIYALTGRSIEGTTAVLALAQSSTLLALALLTYHITGRWLLAGALPALCAFSFPFILYNRLIWNLSIVPGSLAWALLLAVSNGRPQLTLPLLALTTSSLAQAHMGYAPIAVLLLGAGLAGVVLTHRNRAWRPVLACGAVLGLCWSPVVLDAWQHQGGNIGRLWAHFSTERPGHDWREVSGALSRVWREGLPAGLTPMPFLLVCAGLVASRLAWDRARRPGLGSVGVVITLTWLTLVLSVMRVPGAIDEYYLRAMVVLVVPVAALGIATGLAWLPQRGGAVAAGLVALVVLAIVWQPARAEYVRFRSSDWNAYRLDHMDAVAALMKNAADACCEASPVPAGSQEPCGVAIDFAPPDLAGAAPSLRLLMARRHVPVVRANDRCAYRVRRDLPARAGPRAFSVGPYRVESASAP